jgi:hypothetical protein
MGKEGEGDGEGRGWGRKGKVSGQENQDTERDEVR